MNNPKLETLKKHSLKSTSTLFFGISLFISTVIPFLIFVFYILTKKDYDGDLLIAVIPAIINGLMIPIYKILSFHQNTEELLDKNLEVGVKYLNEKIIIYTESFLLAITTVPFYIYYTYKICIYFIFKDFSESTYLFIFLGSCIIAIIIFICVKKFLKV